MVARCFWERVGVEHGLEEGLPKIGQQAPEIDFLASTDEYKRSDGGFSSSHMFSNGDAVHINRNF